MILPDKDSVILWVTRILAPDDLVARDNVLHTMNNEIEKMEKELDEKDELMKQLEEDLEQQDKDLEKIEHVRSAVIS